LFSRRLLFACLVKALHCISHQIPIADRLYLFSPGFSGQRARRAAGALPQSGPCSAKKHSAGKDIGKDINPDWLRSARI
jgi:hypothetical protein